MEVVYNFFSPFEHKVSPRNDEQCLSMCLSMCRWKFSIKKRRKKKKKEMASCVAQPLTNMPWVLLCHQHPHKRTQSGGLRPLKTGCFKRMPLMNLMVLNIEQDSYRCRYLKRKPVINRLIYAFFLIASRGWLLLIFIVWSHKDLQQTAPLFICVNISINTLLMSYRS